MRWLRLLAFLVALGGIGAVLAAPAPVTPGFKLPWTAGQTYSVTQNWGTDCSSCPGAPNYCSHGCDCNPYNCYAYDFGLPLRTELRASNGGDVTVGVVSGPAGDGYTDKNGDTTINNDDCGHSPNKQVNILHPDGSTTVYMHLDEVVVSAADPNPIGQGDLIGYSGCTGWSTGPHLHFQRDVGGTSQSFSFDEYPGVTLDPGQQVTSQNSGDPCPDADGDGVCDDQDACPNTPPGTPVDAQGCPINRPPIADANGDAQHRYYTDEGSNKTLDGTKSSDPDGDPLTYEWDLDYDGEFDDATGPTPTFTMVGQDGVYTVRLRVCDTEPLCAVDQTTVTVNNVAPSVSLASDAPKDEGAAVTVSGVVTDPGWLDPLSATIYWGDGTPPEPVGGVLENVRPDATLTFSISHVYGDNGVFTAEVCASDDDTTTCQTIDLQIDNVDPTAEIDMSGAILVNGIPTFIAHVGDSLDFSGRSTDPGSDDLYLSWDWDDGSPVVTTTYLVNPPYPDPYPSPSIQPRDVTDMQTYAYANACLYEVRFWAEDDDGGMSPVDTANVVIVGNADEVRTAGYWQHQFRSHLTGRGRPHFDQPTLQCYLAISGYMSQVFDEVGDASTFDLAHDVLFVKQNDGDMKELFDRQLLAVWLNFANGSIEYDEPLGIDPLGYTVTDFLPVVASIEEVRPDPAATRAQLEELKNFLEGINLMDG